MPEALVPQTAISVEFDSPAWLGLGPRVTWAQSSGTLLSCLTDANDGTYIQGTYLFTNAPTFDWISCRNFTHSAPVKKIRSFKVTGRAYRTPTQETAGGIWHVFSFRAEKAGQVKGFSRPSPSEISGSPGNPFEFSLSVSVAGSGLTTNDIGSEDFHLELGLQVTGSNYAASPYSAIVTGLQFSMEFEDAGGPSPTYLMINADDYHDYMRMIEPEHSFDEAVVLLGVL